ncbi:hypothetical protein OAI77_05295 [Candidatus Nitrosopelagicus sp.]|nr:hypothetical protein [Candidatus Nitrosopelagicus sp.]
MPKMNRKIVCFSIIIFFVSIIPLSYVHELGHGYICMAEGYEFEIELGVDGGRMICHGEVENQILFRAAGGILAGTAAIIPLVAFKQIKKYPAVVIALLPLGLGHFLNAGIETVFYKTYMQDTVIWGMIMGLFAFLMFIGLVTKYAKKEVTVC